MPDRESDADRSHACAALFIRMAPGHTNGFQINIRENVLCLDTARRQRRGRL